MRVIRKLLVPTLFFIGLLIAGLVTYSTIVSVQQSNAAEEEQLNNMYRTFLARISSQESFAVALAIETANNIEIQKAFAEQDRERLIELTLPGYKEVDARFGVPQEQFHLPPATSFLRLHSLENYGDDLADIRLTIVEANQEKHIVQGVEVGRAGLGIRGVSPVKYNDEHIGAVEFGLNLDQKLLDTLKEDFDFDFQMGISQEAAKLATFVASDLFIDLKNDQIILQASTLEEPFLASANNYIQALNSTPTLEHLTVSNRKYAILTVPIIDFSGKAIGTIDIISDHTAIAEQQRRQVILSVGVFLGALLLVGFGFSAIAGRTLRPIGLLTIAANAISAGDFTKTANFESDDELGTLANAFNTMAEEIQENVRTLEERVAARTKAQETVAEISTTVATILDLQEMLERTVHLTQRGFGLYHAHVFTYHEAAEELRIVACGYQEGDEHEGTHGTTSISITQEQSLVARAARDRAPVIVNDVRNEPGWLPNPLLPDTRAELAVPMIVGNELLGVLDVQSDHLNAFSAEDANIQLTLSSQIAVAMKNAASYAESQYTQALLTNALELSQLGNWTYDPTTDIFTFNDQFYAVFQTSVQEVGGYKLSSAEYAQKFVYPDDVPIVSTQIQSVIESNERHITRKLQHRVIFPNGETGYISVNFNVERDEKGNIISFTGANQNITDRRRLEIEMETRARRETAINQISQKIQQAGTIEEAMQIAVRELGNALGKRKTLVALDPGALHIGQEQELPNDSK